MATIDTDPWASWLLQRRHGGNEDCQRIVLENLKAVRDKVIENANLGKGQTLLDVGTGDGLIGFSATEKAGADGTVIFSDLSEQLLDVCKEYATQADLLDRCKFVKMDATDLSPIESESVDAVTTRSVIIYVADKQRAFDEFYRVLKPGTGSRLSMFEPIAKLRHEFEPKGIYLGYDVRPIKDLMEKIAKAHEPQHASQSTMGDFDERDLLKMLQKSGFSHIEMELRVTIGNAGMYSKNWEAFYNSAPNPLVSTFREELELSLTQEERERVIAYLRPLVESNTGRMAQCMAYIHAEK